MHTNISPCGCAGSTPEHYFQCALEAGIDTIGFSNHFWDSDVPGANEWYKSLGVDRLMQIRDQIGDTKGVRALIGAEVEFPGRLALTYEHSKLFDYVLITTSHFFHEEVIAGHHMNDWTDARNLLVERFLLGVAAGADLPIPVSMAHIFRPLGEFCCYQEDIIASISDRMFLEMFAYAAEKHISIEIHLPILKHCGNEPGKMAPQGVRMYQLAKKAGCTFTIGSDEHNWESFVRKTGEIHSLAAAIGITQDDMMEM